MSYEIQLTPEIKAFYTPWKGDPNTGCKASLEITWFENDVEIYDPLSDACLRISHEHKLWADLKARMEQDVLDKILNDLVLEPSEWLTGGVK